MGGPGLDPREAEVRGSAEHLLATKELHSQKGKDDDKEEKEEQQADDGFHGVEKRHDQVPERCPVPANRGQGWGGGGQAGPGWQQLSPPSQHGGGGPTLAPVPIPIGMPGNPKDLLCDFENTQ